MPAFIKTKEDERLWSKAKGIAEKSGHKEDWAYITGIFKKMKGGKVASNKYEGINFKPPASVANAAKKGLGYRAKASPSNRGGLTPSEASKQGIGSGVQRATNLKNRDTLSPKVVKQMAAFFSRHEKNKAVDSKHKGEPWNDKGHVAWLLWGGDPGKTWANKVVKQMESADSKKAKQAGLEDACEEGYEAYGFKEMDGRKVPNCIPKRAARLAARWIRRAALQPRQTTRLVR